MRLTFHLSTNCNLRCTYCYQKHKDSKVLAFDDAKKLLDDLFNYRANNEGKIFKYFNKSKEFLISDPIKLDFFGGEATLYIDLIDQICTYFKTLCDKYGFNDWKENFTITLQTNGTTFFEPKVYEFIQKYLDKIDLPITIDGCKECHDSCRKYVNGKGSYDDVEKAVLEHKKLLYKDTNSKLTFCKENMKYITACIKNAIRLGYSGIRGSFDLVSEENRLNSEESEQFYDYLTEACDYIIDNKIEFHSFLSDRLDLLLDTRFDLATCGSNGTQIVIDWEGDLYFCQQLSTSYLPKESAQCIGNIDEGITHPEIVAKFRNRKITDLKFNRWCRDCPFKSFCEPCPARNILKYNDVLKYDFNCGAGLAQARAALYFCKRAKETNYPYINQEILKQIEQKYPNFEIPDRDYALYNKEEW